MDKVEARSIQIEDIEEIIVNDMIEGIGHDEDLSVEVAEIRKDKKARMNNILVKTTQAHELFVQSFEEVHLRLEGKNFFPRDHDASDFVED